jgi:hypothetical protein
MKHLTKVIGITSAVCIVFLSTSLTAPAMAGDEQKNNARPSRIVGLWDVQVEVANCAGGPVVFRFPAMHQYNAGGTGQVAPGTNPAALSAHMMVWTHLGGNDYLARFKMFRFDAGVLVGWTEVTNEVSINEDATEYSGTGMAESYDKEGNFQMASCPSFTGTRITAEP